MYIYLYTHIYIYIYTYTYVRIYSINATLTKRQHGAGSCPTEDDMGWLRLVDSLKWKVSLAEYRLFCRALLQKRLIILRSLLVVATPYGNSDSRLVILRRPCWVRDSLKCFLRTQTHTFWSFFAPIGKSCWHMTHLDMWTKIRSSLRLDDLLRSC